MPLNPRVRGGTSNQLETRSRWSGFQPWYALKRHGNEESPVVLPAPDEELTKLLRLSLLTFKRLLAGFSTLPTVKTRDNRMLDRVSVGSVGAPIAQHGEAPTAADTYGTN